MRQIALFVIGILIGMLIVLLSFRTPAAPKADRDSGSVHAPLSHAPMSYGYSTIIIDSCEYIEAVNRLAHKGNCCFCKERNMRGVE